MSLITISDLTTSESFISEISEIETGVLLGGLKVKVVITKSFNTNTTVKNGASLDNSGIIGSLSGNVIGNSVPQS